MVEVTKVGPTPVTYFSKHKTSNANVAHGYTLSIKLAKDKLTFLT